MSNKFEVTDEFEDQDIVDDEEIDEYIKERIRAEKLPYKLTIGFLFENQPFDKTPYDIPFTVLYESYLEEAKDSIEAFEDIRKEIEIDINASIDAYESLSNESRR